MPGTPTSLWLPDVYRRRCEKHETSYRRIDRRAHHLIDGLHRSVAAVFGAAKFAVAAAGVVESDRLSADPRQQDFGRQAVRSNGLGDRRAQLDAGLPR